jgi:hypothetical protein
MKCRQCEEEKLVIDYYKGRRICKECIKVNVKKWKAENKQLHTKYCEKWRISNRIRFNETSRKYQREHYNPEKAHLKYIKYYTNNNHK